MNVTKVLIINSNTKQKYIVDFSDEQLKELAKEIIERLKREYPVGTRVELVSMQDEYVKLAAGEKGTVMGVDDIGTIHVDWDCGSGLGIAYGEDLCKKVVEE